MTKTASSRRTFLFSIIPFIIILLILFLTMWLPFLGIMKECNGVFSGKISSKDGNLGIFNFDNDTTSVDVDNLSINFDNDTTIVDVDNLSIKGSIMFVSTWNNGEIGVIYAISNRNYYDGNGKKIYSKSNEPMKIRVIKVDGTWKIANIFYTVP